ncbi:hypothetical protein Raf01_15090 [Rugosimonospora africana]|uniref:Uncharacterized protein n=1 Tax=Rugosimonospora africana TaxID=556532 RepID=A0A8J3QNL3_9ACTN|nr:hypothetical protein Raf01_15090 [Rugosimonospora africana]
MTRAAAEPPRTTAAGLARTAELARMVAAGSARRAVTERARKAAAVPARAVAAGLVRSAGAAWLAEAVGPALRARPAVWCAAARCAIAWRPAV